ncbi:hypothetical protein [Hyunsoonleella ulvae]|uniref:hypothetical protein n=1 Tax=Hyunsoonleella ulvae TaxID=2799948 RepID=UPI00193AC943|nr:hypothetical protein [Hyunsoonleella ulvae]
MKTITIALMAIFLSMSFFSCSPESISGTDDLYDNIQATEGDDGEVVAPPPPPGPQED